MLKKLGQQSQQVNPYVILVISLLAAFGPTLASVESWEMLMTPGYVGNTLAVLAGVALAWAGRSPIKP